MNEDGAFQLFNHKNEIYSYSILTNYLNKHERRNKMMPKKFFRITDKVEEKDFMVFKNYEQKENIKFMMLQQATRNIIFLDSRNKKLVLRNRKPKDLSYFKFLRIKDNLLITIDLTCTLKLIDITKRKELSKLRLDSEPKIYNEEDENDDFSMSDHSSSLIASGLDYVDNYLFVNLDDRGESNQVVILKINEETYEIEKICEEKETKRSYNYDDLKVVKFGDSLYLVFSLGFDVMTFWIFNSEKKKIVGNRRITLNGLGNEVFDSLDNSFSSDEMFFTRMKKIIQVDNEEDGSVASFVFHVEGSVVCKIEILDIEIKSGKIHNN